MSDSRTALGFEPVTLTDEERQLMLEVREFARAKPFAPSPQSPTRGGFDRAFSEDLARHGWVGMTIPRRYAGSARWARRLGATAMADQTRAWQLITGTG